MKGISPVSTTSQRPPRWSSAQRGHVQRLCGLTAAEVEQIFSLLDDPSCWLLGPKKGSWLIRVAPGPGVACRAAFFKLAPLTALRVEAGSLLVLQGSLRLEDGTLLPEGAPVVQLPTAQVLTSPGPGESLCFAVSPLPD